MQLQNTIIEKKILAESIKEFVVFNPYISQKSKPGQFVVLRIHDRGERIPLTIADYNPTEGTITIVFQEVGKTTKQLGRLNKGETIMNLAGPLGVPSEIENYGTVICVGGGVGIAPIYPIARALKNNGNKVISIIGARTKELLIWESQIRQVSDAVYITTDDGSYGRKGFVSDELKEIIRCQPIDRVFAVGPAIMMKTVCEVTKQFNIKTIVSLNPIMVDASGMCGCCRVTVGGKTKFVCMDGPEFDGHQVDFDELINRQKIYLEEEKRALMMYKGVVVNKK